MKVTDIKEITKRITYVLQSAESIDYAFLFGSALKRLLPQSDIDILVGGEIDFNQRMLLTAELSRRLSRNVDLVLAKETRSELVIKAMSQGLPVFVKNKEVLKKDYITHWKHFDDTVGLRRIRLARIQKQYTNG